MFNENMKCCFGDYLIKIIWSTKNWNKKAKKKKKKKKK